MNEKNDALPDFKVELDKNGMPILPTEGQDISVLKKGTIKVDDDDEFASEEDILTIGAGGKTLAGKGDIEQASRPKLSKNGVGNNFIKNPQNNTQKPAAAVIDIEEVSIRHLIETAEKSEQSIKFEITIDAIDTNLFKVLSKSYKDKSPKIIQFILESNKKAIDDKIIESIKEHYEKQSEEENN